jgi:hypothetical protein
VGHAGKPPTECCLPTFRPPGANDVAVKSRRQVAWASVAMIRLNRQAETGHGGITYRRWGEMGEPDQGLVGVVSVWGFRRWCAVGLKLRKCSQITGVGGGCSCALGCGMRILPCPAAGRAILSGFEVIEPMPPICWAGRKAYSCQQIIMAQSNHQAYVAHSKRDSSACQGICPAFSPIRPSPADNTYV